MPQERHRVRRRSERAAQERDSRKNHCDYAESARKLELQREEGLERTRLRLEQQRAELQRQARARLPRA
jgi:hypothetical protein